MEDPDLHDLARRLRARERRALARAITLVESTRADHRNAARRLLAELAPHTGSARRIGLSGTPGVGKSTFIEAFGTMLTGQGLRVAVLAVDPSSTRSGGAILGDKTRMDTLARDPNAFVRPSPSGRELGGVARRTRETIALVEAAGYDVVLVETVGVGQSETAVAGMTDVFLLLLAPGGGDELQGVKRGIMESADIIVVNKGDGALKPVAEATRADYMGALRLLRRRPGDPPGIPTALTASAVTGEGLAEVWERISALDAWRTAEGWKASHRAEQSLRWFETAIERGLLERFRADSAVRAALPGLRAEVVAGRVSPEDAADRLLERFAPAAADPPGA